jgi:DnaB-like helicase C terminal domain
LTIAAESDPDATKSTVLLMNALRQVAKSTGVTVLVVSHVSRASGNDGTQMPRLANMKNSSAVEQLADCVIGIARSGITTTLKLLKNSRVWGGSNGSIELEYKGHTFVEVGLDDSFEQTIFKEEEAEQPSSNQPEQQGESYTHTEDSTIQQPQEEGSQVSVGGKLDEGQPALKDGTLRTGSISLPDTDIILPRLAGAGNERDSQQREVHRSEGLLPSTQQGNDESMAAGVSRSRVGHRKFRPER